MANTDYSKLRGIAERLIKKSGFPSDLIKKGITGGIDPSTGKVVPDTPDVIINGTVTPMFMYKTSEIDGTSIQVGDGYVFFHSDGSPEIGMLITINGLKYRVVNVMGITSPSPADIQVFVKIQLRK